MKIDPKINCELAKVSRIVGDFWNLLIINQLLSGCKRFNELVEIIPNITNSTLSDRLKKLVEEGVVERKQYEEIPLKVEYNLSKKGLALRTIVIEMLDYEVKHLQ